jgi:hypothetical protein
VELCRKIPSSDNTEPKKQEDQQSDKSKEVPVYENIIQDETSQHEESEADEDTNPLNASPDDYLNTTLYDNSAWFPNI